MTHPQASDTPLVEVTQADVRRAEEWAREWKNCAGEMTALYDAFARHRLASQPANRADTVELTDLHTGEKHTINPAEERAKAIRHMRELAAEEDAAPDTASTDRPVGEGLAVEIEALLDLAGHKRNDDRVNTSIGFMRRILTALRAAKPADEGLRGLLREAWQPRIGERVEATEHCPDAELWNRVPLYVIGVSVARSMGSYGPGYDVTISTTWPEISEPTDGFYVGRQGAGFADELRPARIDTALSETAT